MQYSVSIDIDAPPALVAQIMCDVERWPEWTASVTSVRLDEPGPLKIGSTATIRQPRFPTARWRVSVLEPDRGFAWDNRGPGVFVRGSHFVTPRGAGSIATLSLDYKGLLAILVAKLTKGITFRYLKMESEGLKRRSEELASRAG
jgi:hypothetical protein